MGRITRRRWLGHLGLATAGLSPLGGLLGCSEPVQVNKEKADPLMGLDEEGVEPEVIRIGITPSTGADTGARLRPLIDYLGRAAQVTATGRTAKSYDHLAELVDRKEVELGIFSPLSYVNARRNRVQAIAIATATRYGSPTYLGYLVGRRQGAPGALRPLLQEYRGKRIAWVNMSSTSGYLYPRDMLHERGVDPDAFFGEQLFAGNHKAALQMVIDGKADLAAVASNFVHSGGVKLAGVPSPDVSEGVGGDAARDPFVTVAKTHQIPLDCVVVHKTLKRSLGVKLRSALEGLVNDEKANELLAETWGLDGFVRPMNEAYDQVAEAAKREQKRAAKKTG